MEQGHAAWTDSMEYSVNMKHGHAGRQHGHEGQVCSMDKQHG
jgi:hypothetical protein